MDIVERLFAQYGYLVLLFGLPLELIALPIPPGNTTLAYAGYLSYKHVLELLPTFAAAYSGTILGITTTYWIGNKLGLPLIEKYGKWFFLKPKHFMKAKLAYEKYGKKMLLFGFFLPGVRQINSYFAGITHVPFCTFVLYAYTGTALWVSVFIGVGYVFGNQWQLVFTWIEHFFSFILIILCCTIAILLLLKWRNWLRGRRGIHQGELE
ncbi:DedA family protein [Robertmurraya yapensis]|uniref:DedA family protein n=1 Tax=Bacillus yapensis TaxID=2492960 RepID=A0A431W7H0_9BACI|nr:DedA family protein [Bacillus yapensis]RTR31432.1 DedA family protein [Bacillus yapensis]TKS95656.1 DedA family protein [Bacillus yapensis]